MEERALSEMTNEEVELFIEQLRERRKNVSMKRIEERLEVREKREASGKKKNTFGSDASMNSLLDDILGDL